MSIQILLDSVEKVRKFVDMVSARDEEFDLLCGRYVVDAKSILGVMSLDLAQPLTLKIYADAIAPDLEEELKPYLA